MTRTRKLTLSVKEFSHLVSESLDLTNVVPAPQPFIDNTAVLSETSQKTYARPSSFQRIFSRPTPTPGQHENSPQSFPEDLPETPRKMIGWPFSRSPRKNRPTKDEDHHNITITEVNDPDGHGTSPYSVSSLAAASTSSLGSIVPAHERLFQLTSRDSDEPSQDCHSFTIASSSPVTIAPPRADDPPTASGCYAGATPLDEIFGNGSATSIAASSNDGTVEPVSGTSCQESLIRPSLEGTDSVAISEPESFDEDPTPRASTFGPRTTPFPSVSQDNLTLAQRGRKQRLSLVVPSRNLDILALRPAVGVAPHPPSETESSVSLCSTSSPTSPVAQGSSPISPTTGPSEAGTLTPVPPPPPNVYLSPGIASSSNLESAAAPPLGLSPRQRMRAMSRSLTPPPLPRPPPTGPLPAVPSLVPPVPPLPPLLNKMSTNVGLHSAVSSTPRSSIGAPTCLATALPPSPPGGLRLPSRLSWVNSVRAVLPSPPASPTKSLRSLTGKTSLPTSPSKAEIKRTKELKRPTSIGVIEAADNVQVRRTKSILLLGSRSKSNVSLGTKRVQIHADVNLEANPTLKPRRKSSAATVGHLAFSSDVGPGSTPMQGSELLVLRERRHSAPVLSSIDTRVSADWTLSLPFCTDVPGEKILLSPLLTPRSNSEHSLEEVGVEDWTLCMPLKVRVDTPTIGSSEGRRDSECTEPDPDAAETVAMRPITVTQLPTPSPSPTWPSPASIDRPLEPEQSEPVEVEVEVDRPATPASLGPHVGGLDLDGGRGKRASGWHVYGWFDEVDVPEEECHVVVPTASTAVSDCRLVKNHVTVFRKTHDAGGRHPSQDSMSSVSTSEATYYSARSSLLVN